jgi:hypothetical protein
VFIPAVASGLHIHPENRYALYRRREAIETASRRSILNPVCMRLLQGRAKSQCPEKGVIRRRKNEAAHFVFPSACTIFAPTAPR